MKKNEIDSLLMTVAYENVTRLPKRKLLWMLGWKYDKPGVWEQLLDAWADLDFDRECLYGFEHDNYITLIYTPGTIDNISEWIE